MECNFDGNTDRLFCLGAYYFFKSSRKRSKIKELTFEDNVVEQDRLACMWEEGLTEPLAEQTRPKALTEIIGQEKAIRALRAALCGPNPQHVLIYGPPGVGKTAAARLILEEQSANTRQNLQNSLPLLEERGFDSCGGRVAIVTNDFHMARVTLLWNLPAKVVQVPARLPWRWLSANYYLRESFAVVNDLVIRPLLA